MRIALTDQTISEHFDEISTYLVSIDDSNRIKGEFVTRIALNGSNHIRTFWRNQYLQSVN